MNVDNALHKFKNALFALSLGMEVIKSLTRADSSEAIQQAIKDEREAWRKLGAARRELVEACLESIGR